MPFLKVGATGGVRATMSNKDPRRFEKSRKIDLHQFLSDQIKDGYEFLVSFHERLESLGLVDSYGIDYRSFQMRGYAKQLWHLYIDSRTTCYPSMT